MDTNQLRTWLGLPPGPWPPDDRTLLGFGPGSLSAMDVEVRALERMELLRPHQLTQPDLVTEGMNRLAQAMIGLTDNPAPPPPPPKPRKQKKPKPAEPEVETIDLRRDINDPGFMMAEIVDAEPVTAAATVLDAQPVAEKKAPPKPKRPKAFRAPDRLPPEPLKLDEVPPSTQEPPAPPAGLVVAPSERRRAYTRLVRLRRLLDGLDRLKPYYSDPGEQLLTPVKLYGFVEAVTAFREIDARINWPVPHGLLVRELATNALPISMFRSLVASQRRAVAADWARAKAEVEQEYRLAREALRTNRPHSRWANEWRTAKSWLMSNPEWLPGLLFLVAFAVALARTAARAR